MHNIYLLVGMHSRIQSCCNQSLPHLHAQELVLDSLANEIQVVQTTATKTKWTEEAGTAMSSARSIMDLPEDV